MENSKGVALIFAMIIIGIFSILVGGLLTVLEREYFFTYKYYSDLKALSLAEAGIDKALFELQQDSSYSGESNTNLDTGIFSTTVTDLGDNNKQIESTGCYPSAANCKTQKIIRVTVSTNPSLTEVSFRYAVHIGDLGLLMYGNSQVNGNTYSNGNITGYSNSKINGDAYAVGTISSPPQVSGTKHPGSPSITMPQINLDYWRTQANINNDPITGNYQINDCSSPMVNLGPRKIVGNFAMNSNSCLKITGPVYITGNFEMNSNSKLYLDDRFSSYGTVIVVDGTIKLNSNSHIYTTSAVPKGYILLATPSTASPAIELNSNASTSIFYALSGEVQVNSNGKVTEVVGRKLTLNSNATLDYDIGLVESYFTTGPGGTWTILKGTWTELK